MKKRFLCIVMAGLSLFSLTACSDITKIINNLESASESTEKVEDIHITELEGKTYKEVLSEGYRCDIRMYENDQWILYLTSDNIPENADDYFPELSQMTINDLLEKNIDVGGIPSQNGTCRFNISAGSVVVEFEVENPTEIIQAHQNKIYFDINDGPSEMYNKQICNPRIVSIRYTLTFKDDVSAFMGSDFNEEALSDYVVSEVYYTPVETAFK